MALEDIGERLGAWGWVGAGLGVVILAPKLIPALGRGLRPVAKGTLKGCMALTDKTRGVLAETGERWHDLVAEARAEHAVHAVEETRDVATEPVAGTIAGEEEATIQAASSAEEGPKSKARSSRKSEEAPSEAA